MTENIPIFDGVTGILIHTSVKLVTASAPPTTPSRVILIHTSVKLVTSAFDTVTNVVIILIHTSVKLVTLSIVVEVVLR